MFWKLSKKWNRHEWPRWFARLFMVEGRFSYAVLIAFLSINFVVLTNALLHDPFIGYDTPAYLEYIEVLSEGRFPTSEETGEFFSAPMAFIPPAISYALLRPWQVLDILNPPNNNPIANFLYYRFTYSIDDFAMGISAKISQLLNVAYSIVLTVLLLAICERLRPGDKTLKILTLFLLGILTVYYKSFAFVRAEPLLATLCVGLLYWILRLLQGECPRFRFFIIGGILTGLILLSRQWGFAALPVVVAAVIVAGYRQGWSLQLTLFRSLSVLSFSLILAAPFYLHLARTEGSAVAFNRDSLGKTEVWDYSPAFFLDPRLDQLFIDPVVNSFGPHILPIFYSETWGDYGAYFVVYGRNRKDNKYVLGVYLDHRIVSPEEAASGQFRFITNRYEINRYLGRVNAVSIFPSLILLSGLVFGLHTVFRSLVTRFSNSRQAFHALLTVFIAGSLFGYLIFIVLFTGENPTTVKSTYMLQIFPFLALLGGEVLRRLSESHPSMFRGVIAILVLVALHNLPVFITRQILWPYSPFGG